jgi:hypothetical protein
MLSNTRICLLLIIISSFLFQSCYRNDITFGNLPDSNYSNVVSTDTVEPILSTVTLDSFVTNNISSFLLGKYNDPYMGIISAKPFFQMTILSDTLKIPAAAVYDSLCFIIHPNKYYYGDTSLAQTIYVNELAGFINYTYGNYIFNTSSFPVMPTPLGSKTLKIRPSADTSIMIRLSDVKGLEFFSKLKQRADEILTDANFQNYFKGISLSVGDNDTSAVYGLNASATSNVMRVFYHNTTPYFQSSWADFTLKPGGFSFNQVIPDRSGTPLHSTASGTKEFPSEQTDNMAFTQYGTGALLKLTFPYLKGIMTTDKIVRLQKAVLIIRPIGSSYDFNKFKLPASLSLVQTDATNAIGQTLVGAIVPVTDEIYGVNTYYQADVTSYINTLLTTTGSEDNGLFLIGSNNSPNADRAVIGNNEQPLYRTQLLLTAIIINK